MALSAFADKAHRPTDRELAAALGPAYARWRELRDAVQALGRSPSVVWGYASKASGWGLRVRHGERIILYMTPCEGHFLASIILGEKAIAAAEARPLSAVVRSLLAGAPRYPEGRGVRLPVLKAADVRTVLQLVAIKVG